MANPVNDQVDDLMRSLEDFITHCPELDKLEDRLARFNLFEALRIHQKEMAASDFLRWLLDPSETHGLGALFADRFLKMALAGEAARNMAPLQPVEIDVLDLSGAEVRREESHETRRRTDISLVDSQNKLVLIIENKLFSPETQDQTKAYFDEAVRRFPDFRRIFIFLTPGGQAASAPEFIPVRYSDLLRTLKDLLESRQNDIAPPARFLIEQFVDNVEVNILEESEISKLCRMIYKKHRKAIDRIVSSLPEAAEAYRGFGMRVAKRLGAQWKVLEANSYCQIYREEWLKWFPAKVGPDPFFHYEFFGYKEHIFKVQLHIESYQLGEEIRRRFLNMLPSSHNEVSFDKKTKQVVATGTKRAKLDWDEEKELDELSKEVANWIGKTADLIHQKAEELHKAIQGSSTNIQP